jgi:hypothetical protein
MNITNEQELEKILMQSIDEISKNSIKILAGHMPLLYLDECPTRRSAELGVTRWGAFSTYTFELGAKLLQYSKASGKSGKLMLIVDDLVELPRIEKDGIFYSQNKSWMSRVRKKFYDNENIPDAFEKILSKYDLSVDDLSVQRKKENTSPLISEKLAKANGLEKGIIAPNECSQAYKGVLFDESIFSMEKDYLVGFIPGQCKGNICEGILDAPQGLSSLHVFFPHMESLGGLAQLKSTYEKIREPMSVSDMFKEGLTYQRT